MGRLEDIQGPRKESTSDRQVREVQRLLNDAKKLNDKLRKCDETRITRLQAIKRMKKAIKAQQKVVASLRKKRR